MKNKIKLELRNYLVVLEILTNSLFAYLKQIRSYVESECKTYVDIVQEDINVKKLK